MKLQQTDQYLLLIDEEAEIREGDIYFSCPNGYNSAIIENEANLFDEKTSKKIVAYYPLQENSPKLDLPLLPNPLKNNIDIEALQAGLKEYPYRDINNDLALGGYIRGYKAAQKKFSKEDMIKAFEEGMKWYKKRTTSILDVYNDFIQSLSTQQLPQEFIPEKIWVKEYVVEQDPYVSHTLEYKTITNSYGNKELVGKYK